MHALILAILLTSHASATQTPDAKQTDINQLSWLSGAWVMEKGEKRVEEHWTPPRAGTMMGIGRTMRGDKTVFYEFLRIEATPEGIVYFAAPRGRHPATGFKAIEISDEKAVFENPQHDFPTRITYWKTDDGLGAKIEGKRNGRDASESWNFRRAAD